MGGMVTDAEAYFRTFVPPREKLLVDLEREAQGEGIPIVGPVVGELLFLLAQAVGARRILELGTATGYSAIYLARACEPIEGRVITLEWDNHMADRARENLRKCGLEERVEVKVGDALESMSEMGEVFDLIFMDVDKEYYEPAIPHCRRLLRPGGLLIADNTGFQASDPFNRKIFGQARWRVVNLYAFLPDHSPEYDGLCFALATTP